MKLTLWDRILALFGIRTTWVWCLVGCTIGRHAWSVSLEKCRNGKPIIAGWFLIVYKFSDQQSAEAMLADAQRLADQFNRDHGFWVSERPKASE